MSSRLVVPARFNGPPRSGNGGWSAGALAELMACAPADHDRSWPAVRVRLTSPPPLDTEVDVEVGEAGATCAFGGAGQSAAEPSSVEPVGADEARAAEASYAGLVRHPFPTCFGCGPDRAPDDGLRIFPGRVADAADGAPRVAATWTPHPSVAEDWHAYREDAPRASLPVTWAAVDCVGGWAGDLADRPLVLGQITVQVDTLPVVGEEHVVVGQRLGAEGRRTFTAATLYDEAGRVVARAEHVWVTVDPEAFDRG